MGQGGRVGSVVEHCLAGVWPKDPRGEERREDRRTGKEEGVEEKKEERRERNQKRPKCLDYIGRSL